MRNCPLCNSVGVGLKVPNWKFIKKGIPDTFIYAICNKCGCIYRDRETVDNNILYDEDYGEKGVNEELEKGIKTKIKHVRDSYAYMNKYKIIGKLLCKYRPEYYPFIREYKKRLSKGESFLDVGCRTGSLINELKSVGANTFGCEPYISEPIVYKNGLVVENKFLAELDRKFDIIFYNNVFEHLDYPEKELKTVKEKLSKFGCCGLLFPGHGQLFDVYKENSYIIQAPQHSMLHTEESVRIISEKVGLKIYKIKREPVEAWYIKSELLKEKIDFNETDDIQILKEKLTSDKLLEINNLIKNSRKNNTGDLYHVMLSMDL